MKFNTQYKIFVSSPGDVAKEREIVDSVIARINDSISDSLGIYLTVERWEKMPPETTDEVLQDRLNTKIKDCHFFLLILYKRYGTVMQGETISNTEREINAILEYLTKDQKKKILSYFKKTPDNPDPGVQEKKILALKEQLRQNPRWFYKEFDKPSDFERILTHDLYQILVRMRNSSFKVDQLEKFWQFGKLDNQANPKILVIYPPVPREWMGTFDADNIWERRLLPNIFFEDYKALHKILKNLSLIGLRDYKVYSKFDTPPDYDQSNIIWICLPRQTRGLSSLNLRADKRFIVVPRTNTREPYLKWRLSNGEWIDIKSPLHGYLKEQRLGADVVGEWDRSLGNIVARDYAVIASFARDVPYNKIPGVDKLKEYFLTGIHGLGTWGAAWFIDRYFGIFKDLSKEDLFTVQILVEVEYRDGRIFTVRDVTNESKDFFENEKKMSTIRQVIQEYKEC